MNLAVVIPVYNGSKTLASCLRALETQTLSAGSYDVIVVDDGSTDDSAAVGRQHGAHVISQPNRGAPGARNIGIRAAKSDWVAFTDADCVPSRTWLQRLLEAAQSDPANFGAAGKTIGFDSQTPAARFVDLMGGLDARRNLAHPTFPFAPSANLLYRREPVIEVGCFDERYASYDACDLHTRLRKRYGNAFPYEPRAIVLHRHRASWRDYWRQQFIYGVGYAQFILAHRDQARWTIRHELRKLGDLTLLALATAVPGKDDAALLRRGHLVRNAAQHAGFLHAYYRPLERRRW